MVQAETALALQVLPRSLRWLPWLMSAVLAYFEFDTLGDQQGAVRALWAPLCMLSIPLLAKLWHDRRRGGGTCARLVQQQKEGRQCAQQGSEFHATFGVTTDIKFVTSNPIVVESSSIDIVIGNASPADEAPPALSSAAPRPSMLTLNSNF